MRLAPLTRPLRDERGIALPLALVGLVAITLLVTTALLTSTTELSISRAHQDAASALYDAEGALQQYIAAKAAAATATPGAGLATVEKDASISGALITVTRLMSQTTMTSSRSVKEFDIYGLVAEPSSGRGRVVAAQIAAERTASFFKIDVNAGLTVGGDLNVSGNSTVSDGRGASCDSSKATNAVQVSTGSAVSVGGASNVEGTVDTASFNKTDMVRLLLGGLSPDDAAKLATIKFAAGEFNGRVRSYDGSTVNAKTDKYNWGCPASTGDACASVAGNASNTSYYPIVAIDAGGGTVTIEGNHGQGILIVYNGSLSIRGNFVYSGIVVVDTDLDVQGTGGSSGVKIEGAVLALGENSTVRDNTTGNAVITYNKCIITTAEANANTQALSAAPQTFPYSATAWQEVIK